MKKSFFFSPCTPSSFSKNSCVTFVFCFAKSESGNRQRDVHPAWYHGKAVCVWLGMTNNKEFKEDKEFKDKTNDCTRSRADEDADADVLLIPNAVKVTRERRHTPDCSAVKGKFLKFPKFLKLLTARHHRAAKLHGCLSRHSLRRRRNPLIFFQTFLYNFRFLPCKIRK